MVTNQYVTIKTTATQINGIKARLRILSETHEALVLIEELEAMIQLLYRSPALVDQL